MDEQLSCYVEKKIELNILNNISFQVNPVNIQLNFFSVPVKY